MKPLGDYIFIEEALDEAAQKAEDLGIFIGEVDTDPDTCAKGTVTGVGPLVKEVKVGQKVAFNVHQYDSLFFTKAEKTEVKVRTLVGKVAGIYAVYD